MIIASLWVYSFAANSTIDNAIAWFYSNGLTTKNTATTFKADQGLRRDEAAKFFVWFAKILGKTGYVKSDKECTFSDIKNSWADLKWASVEACKLWLFQGNNGKFNPQQQVTNAQAITVLVRLLAGSQSEIWTHRADSYYAKADELHILNNVKMNNKNDTATRGNVAIIIYNSRDSKTNTTWIKDITGWEDSQETILAYINNKRNKINDCNVKIWNIDTLNKEITNRTWGIIEKMMIQNACWKTNEYSSTLTLTGLTLKQNNNKYTIYSLIDKNWDFAYNEYPVIVFDKTKWTNKLLTIRPKNEIIIV